MNQENRKAGLEKVFTEGWRNCFFPKIFEKTLSSRSKSLYQM